MPLVFWGEPSAEYTAYYSYDEAEEVDERRFNRFVNLGITRRGHVRHDLGGCTSIRATSSRTPIRRCASCAR